MTDIEVVRAIYAGLAERDVERVFELVDPGFVITQDDRLPWGGRHVGHEGLATFGILLGGTIASTVTTGAMFLADGEVVQYGRTVGTVLASGRPFDLPEVHRWRIRDGRAVEAHFAIDTEGMLAVLSAE